MVFKLYNLNGNTNLANSFFKMYAEMVQKLENKEILITTGYAVVGPPLLTHSWIGYVLKSSQLKPDHYHFLKTSFSHFFQHCEYTKCYWIVHFMLCDFYLNKSKGIFSTRFNKLDFDVINKDSQVLRDKILPSVGSYPKD